MAARPTASANAGVQQTTTSSPKTTVQTGSSSGRETSSSSTTTTSNTQNMTDSALSALDTLIKGLMSGSKDGVLAGLGQSRGQWQSAVNNAAQLQSDYSKGAAFEDARAAASATIAEGIEAAMPQITAGIDSAGTSGSALSALLTQKAATDSARSAAKLGLEAAVQYGQISVEAGKTIAGLVDSGDPTVNALLEALGIAKGAVSTTKETTNSSSQSSSSSQSQGITIETGGTQVQTTKPINNKGSSKAKSWEPPASSSVTSNTGGGWQTTYGK